MISLPDDLPDDPVLLKQLLLEALSRQEESAQAYQTHIVDLKEQIKLLRDRLFGRKSEQTIEPNTPQLALFNEPESEPMPLVGDADEEVVAATPRRGKRKPLSADAAYRSHPRTTRTRTDLCLRLPQACDQRRNQRAAGYRADADPRHQTYPQDLRLPWL
jgi:hypothetical protein